MRPDTIQAAKFKAEALAVMRRVQETGVGVTVTSRGRPLVRISPVAEKSTSKGYGCMAGTAEFQVPDEALVASKTRATWGTLREWDEATRR